MKKFKSPAVKKTESVNAYHYAGIFLTALSTLLLEFTMTRILSVSLWYNFAFMIISIALLGFGISGVVLSASKILKKLPVDLILSGLSVLYGISVILCFILMNMIPFDPFSLLSDSRQLLFLPLYYILITIPFFFAGLIISVLLTRFKSEVSKLYFADLIGAGLACFVFVFLMPVFEGNGTIVFVAFFAFITAAIFSFKNYKKIAVFSVILLALSSNFLIKKDTRMSISVSPNKEFINLLYERPDLKLLTEWNAFSKVDVMIDEDDPVDGYKLYIGIIDAGNATTNIPYLKTLPPPTMPADASNLAFAVKDSVDNVYIIGSAGGGEVLTSLYHNAKKVTGVEINGILNELITDKLSYWTGPLIKGNKNVEIITDDARSVLNRREEKYEVIISAHTISASAVSSGAMSMVENYILTEQAVAEYMEKLNDDGILFISRPETQLPKIIATLRKVESKLGINSGNFGEKIFVFRRKPHEGTFESNKSFLAGVVYKKDGFTQPDVINMRDMSSMLGIEELYDRMSFEESVYKKLSESENVEQTIKLLSDELNLDLRPATDNRPFFDNNIGFGNLTFDNMKEVFAQNEKAILALKDKPVAETTLIVLFVQVVIIAGVFLLFPFLFKRKDEKGNKIIFDKKLILYFSVLGLGYIMLQISMMQKFTLFLGQPVYTMLTVISTMLIASGLGSRFSVKFSGGKKDKLPLIFSLIAVFALFIGFAGPELFYAFSKLSIGFRILISVVLIFPLGFFLGMPFPVGISKINESNIVPVCWAVNGFFSVTGTVIAVILAMITGFKIVFLLSALLYLLAYFLIKSKRILNN
jgi:hypothetical protein